MEVLPVSTNTVAKTSKRLILLLLCEYHVLRLEQSHEESQDTTGCYKTPVLGIYLQWKMFSSNLCHSQHHTITHKVFYY